MTGSRMRMLALALLTASALSGCEKWPTAGNSALDRLKPDAAAHAESLAGSDMSKARETGLTLLARLEALAGW